MLNWWYDDDDDGGDDDDVDDGDDDDDDVDDDVDDGDGVDVCSKAASPAPRVFLPWPSQQSSSSDRPASLCRYL